MGDYTEYNIRFQISIAKNKEIVEFLEKWLDKGIFDKDTLSLPQFKHPFFECSRGERLPFSTSAYFPKSGKSGFELTYGGFIDFNIVGSIKNYSNEIQKFVEWVSPFTEGFEDEFMGYSLEDNTNTPNIIRRLSDLK